MLKQLVAHGRNVMLQFALSISLLVSGGAKTHCSFGYLRPSLHRSRTVGNQPPSEHQSSVRVRSVPCWQ